MLRKFFKNESGAALVEIALTVPVFIIPLLLGLIDFGRISQAQLALSEATHSAVIDASIFSSLPNRNETTIKNRMKQVANDNVAQTVGFTSNGKSAEYVTNEQLYCVCFLKNTPALSVHCVKGQTAEKCSAPGDHIIYFAREIVYYQFYPMFPATFKVAGVKFDEDHPGSIQLKRISFLQIAE